ncbi:hypothetical protein H9Q09_20985 [Aurantimonas sp. DM33-3]|uniref:hypothetical protein n=1 Tax=Aurantimonas sp. DM33-3 TaxID=2766955 RepID=UPI0016528749|nr:hypothetical protein [Aurantimonas sp. DM33-3]MBC6718662.1 hypothetical protein [Aurantimonas sp. DM33-3]
MDVISLSERFHIAEMERTIWSQGRLAYREFGRPDSSPFAEGTSEHQLWMSGFEHEQMQRRGKWQALLEMPL